MTTQPIKVGIAKAISRLLIADACKLTTPEGTYLLIRDHDLFGSPNGLEGTRFLSKRFHLRKVVGVGEFAIMDRYTKLSPDSALEFAMKLNPSAYSIIWNTRCHLTYIPHNDKSRGGKHCDDSI